MEGNLIRITFKPREIIEYIKRKGSITTKDLARDFEYSHFEAFRIIIELNKRGIIRQRGYVCIEEENVVRSLWCLTEEGKKIEKWPEKIEMIGKAFPAISKAGKEIVNYILENAKTLGIHGLDELIQRLKSKSPEIMELVNRAHIDILGNFSSQELRQLAQEIKELKL